MGDDTMQTNDATNFTRRDFVKTAAVTTGALSTGALASMAFAAGDDYVKVGVIGCGGRGTGAAYNALQAAPNVHIVALADLFADRMNGTRQRLANDHADRGAVGDESCFVGFDAYTQLLEHADVDYVILATPPHFRPSHFQAAINAGKNVFMEKPVAVDATGIRTVLQAAEQADVSNLSVVAGTQRRHEACYLEMMDRIRDGAIGHVTHARCWWNQGGLWSKTKEDIAKATGRSAGAVTDMEWQIRNWLYFTWLSGDHICEQHIHNIDVCNWAMGAHPIKCTGLGGRQMRTAPRFGQIFDHFAIEYEYPGGLIVTSQCRQIDGCANRVAEAIHGATGYTWSSSGHASMRDYGGSSETWRFTGDNPNPYVQEHRDLIASITGSGKHLNEAKRVAESTMTAIMGRMSAYTGKEVSWEQAVGSQLDLTPERYAFGPIAVPPVPQPGRTPLI